MAEIANEVEGASGTDPVETNAVADLDVDSELETAEPSFAYTEPRLT